MDPFAGTNMALRCFREFGRSGVGEFVESARCFDFEGVDEPEQALQAGEIRNGGALVGNGELHAAQVADDLVCECEFHVLIVSEGV